MNPAPLLLKIGAGFTSVGTPWCGMKKYYAYYLGEHDQGVVEGWDACEQLVHGAAGARFRGFATRRAAEEWLEQGAHYDAKKRRTFLQEGAYFDAGTGRGLGVEVLVTDRHGTGLLGKVLPKNTLTRFGTFRVQNPDATNNYGELLGCYHAMRIATARGMKKVFGDSKLVIDYWSRGVMREKNLPEQTLRLVKEVAELRKRFEDEGGEIQRISGDDNPADLGFHK